MCYQNHCFRGGFSKMNGEKTTNRPLTAYAAGSFKALAETKLGQQLWKFVNREEIVARLDTATDLGSPAVAGIEEPLLSEFGVGVLDDRTKQMIGHMVRQVMDAEGYEVEKQNVKISSALFSKGTRYRQHDWQRLHVFRNTQQSSKLCFASSRNTQALPSPADGGEWRFWASFATSLRGQIVYGVDVREVRQEVAAKGFALRTLRRIMRPANKS
jgi:hypothetical protein